MKACIIGFEDEIIDPPVLKENDYKYWEKCEGCSDCRDACPVGAIHNEKELTGWIAVSVMILWDLEIIRESLQSNSSGIKMSIRSIATKSDNMKAA